ncbi:MAG: hypothetical protein U1E70_26485 [Acetobacteraceae bacterium]|nr:hypothetical protein [Pseudomonadota bacterium]
MRLPILFAAAALALVSLSACQRAGPGERAGRSLDKAGQNLSDAVNPPQGPVEAAGRKVDRAIGN